MTASVESHTTLNQMIRLIDLCKDNKWFKPRRKSKKNIANEWTQAQKLAYFDSIIRGTEFAPDEPITIKPLEQPNRYYYEVLDGWKRISAIRDFWDMKIRLPYSLHDIPEYKDHVYEDYVEDDITTWCIAGFLYDLPTEKQNKVLRIDIPIVIVID